MLLLWCLALFASLSFAQNGFSGDKYQRQSRFAKRDALWSVIQENQTPLNFPNVLKLSEIFLQSMTPTMNFTGDHFPNQYLGKLIERKKLIHTVGVHVMASFNITANPRGYTGLFNTGCDSTILRFSTATAPKEEMGLSAFVPGIGLKFLRDNTTAANMFAMYSLVGQMDYNFFSHDFSNHVPAIGDSWMPLALKALAKKFRSVSSWESMIGLSDMARWDQHGREYMPHFPYRLVFHPNNKYHTGFPSGWTGVPYWEQLASGLQPGHVYSVYAQDEPLQGNDKLFKIGDINLNSFAITSTFGDKHLFLQHTAFESDLKLKPNWVSAAQQDVDNQKSVPSPGYTYPDLLWN